MENHSPNNWHMSSEAEKLACEFARRVEHAVEGLQQLLDITSDNDGRITSPSLFFLMMVASPLLLFSFSVLVHGMTIIAFATTQSLVFVAEASGRSKAQFEI
jgi:hypothetical protein